MSMASQDALLREPDSTDETAALPIALPANIGSTAFGEFDLSVRLTAMRRLSLSSREGSERNRQVDALLHIFLFPWHITNMSSDTVRFLDYMSVVDLNTTELKEQGEAYLSTLALSKDELSPLGDLEFLMFPWFLLTQKKLAEIDHFGISFSGQLSRDTMGKMPSVFFREFEKKHPKFKDFLTGHLGALMNAKERWMLKKKDNDFKYNQKKYPASKEPRQASRLPVVDPALQLNVVQQATQAQFDQGVAPLVFAYQHPAVQAGNTGGATAEEAMLLLSLCEMRPA
jgi:hypothetical protein